MKNTNHTKQEVHRRDFIKGSAAASLGLTSGLLGIPGTFGQSPEKRNAIQLENARLGLARAAYDEKCV